jgi:hypothetical protein
MRSVTPGSSRISADLDLPSRSEIYEKSGSSPEKKKAIEGHPSDSLQNLLLNWFPLQFPPETVATDGNLG